MTTTKHPQRNRGIDWIPRTANWLHPGEVAVVQHRVTQELAEIRIIEPWFHHTRGEFLGERVHYYTLDPNTLEHTGMGPTIVLTTQELEALHVVGGHLRTVAPGDAFILNGICFVCDRVINDQALVARREDDIHRFQIPLSTVDTRGVIRVLYTNRLLGNEGVSGAPATDPFINSGLGETTQKYTESDAEATVAAYARCPPAQRLANMSNVRLLPPQPVYPRHYLDKARPAACADVDFEKAERGLIGEDLVLPKYKKYLEGLESRDKAQAGAQPPAKSIAFDLETLSPKGLVAPPPGKSVAEILADVQKKMGTAFTDYIGKPTTPKGIRVAIPADTCNGCGGPFNEYRRAVFGGPGFEMCGDCATKDGYRDTAGTIDERIKEAQPPEEPEVKGAWATPTWEEDYG